MTFLFLGYILDEKILVNRVPWDVVDDEVCETSRVLLVYNPTLSIAVNMWDGDCSLALNVSSGSVVSLYHHPYTIHNSPHGGHFTLQLGPDVLDGRLDGDSDNPSRAVVGELDKVADVEATVRGILEYVARL